jgi:retron-type reverse transcriptase
VSKLPVSEHAHGYAKGRSIRTGAEPHVGRKVLLRIDLKDFFPTISFGRVRGLLVALGYGYRVAAALAALMTEAERQPVEVNGEICFVPVGTRHTVQGAPTSPGLSNCILLRLDRRLAGLARKFGFTYTRYADDLTFSGDEDGTIHRLRKHVEGIIKEEGFEANPAKTTVARRGRCQRVTGVVVNEQLGLSRQQRRRLRAAIHQLGKAQLAGPALAAQLRIVRGKLAYVAMLNPAQAEALHRHLPP